jgi:hypothetical protein
MAIKKKVKKRVVVRKVVQKIQSQPNEGFFTRMKEIIKSEMPRPENVRVKTFIVEKPVIIHDKAQNYDSDGSVYDSKKSRYSRNSLATGMGLVKQKKKVVEEEISEANSEDEQFSDDSAQGDELDANSDEFTQTESDEELGLVDDGAVGEEGEGSIEEEPIQEKTPTHTRSRAMFNNIWWKKALFWSILFWLFILAISMAMQAMKLIIVDLTRQWWMLLGIIVVIEMIYFKFLDGKLNI